MQSALRSARHFASWLLLIAASLTGFMGACLTAALFLVHEQEGRLLHGDLSRLGFGLALVTASFGVGFLAFFSIRQLQPEALRMRSTRSGEFEHQAQRYSEALIAFAVATFVFSCASGTFGNKLLVAFTAAAAFWICTHLSIFLHELGHFGAARMTGLELYRFQSGIGPVIWRWKALDGPLWEWRLFARGGLVIAWWPEERLDRWKAVAYFGGGPLANLCIVGLAGLSFDHLLARSAERPLPHPSFVFTLAFLLWSGIATIVNLIPWYVTVGNARMPSDGLQILRLFRHSRETEVDARVTRLLARLGRLRLDRFYDRAWEELHDAFRRYPQAIGRLRICEAGFYLDDGAPKSAIEALEAALAMESLAKDLKLEARALLARASAAAGDIERSRGLAEEVLKEAEPKKKLHYLEVFACIPVLDKAPALLPDAGRWCGLGLQLQPRSIGFTALAAAVGVERGELDLAERQLRSLLRGFASDGLRAFIAYYLALLLTRRGGSAHEIKRLRRKALEWCDSRALLRRIERDLPESVSPSASEAPAALPSRARAFGGDHPPMPPGATRSGASRSRLVERSPSQCGPDR